jgi:hypothetical protein
MTHYQYLVLSVYDLISGLEGVLHRLNAVAETTEGQRRMLFKLHVNQS